MDAGKPFQPGSGEESSGPEDQEEGISDEGSSSPDDLEKENSDQESLDSNGQEEKNKELMEAARDGSVARARAALNSRADIDWMDYSRCPWEATPVLEAITMGHRKLANFLIDKGADPNISDYRENTPLLIAASAGWPDVVKNLVDSGASVNHKNGNDEDAFSFAFAVWGDNPQEDMKSVLSHLLSGQVYKERVSAAFVDAFDLKIYDAALVFLDHDETLATERVDDDPVLHAAASKDVDLVKKLLQLGASVAATDSCEKTTALWNAVMNRNVETTKILLQHGSEPNTSLNGDSLLVTFYNTRREDRCFTCISLMLMKSGARTSYHLLGDEAWSSIKKPVCPVSQELEERMTKPSSLQEQAIWRVRKSLRESGECQGRSIVDAVSSLNLSGILKDFLLLKHL